MKKKLLSMFLALCMTVSLFAGLSVGANADTADKVTGYLTSYVFKAGDTIYGVCEAKKIDFNANLNKIGKINNIPNYNSMYPGTQLWLPSTTATTDAPYYSLLTHVVKSGETVATLCQSYGVDYNTNYKLLAALNANINTFMAGQNFILPLYVIPSGSTATPTPAPSTAPSAAPTTTATATPAPTPAPDGSGTYTGTITEVTGSSITVGGVTFGIRGSDLTGTAKVGYTATVTYTAVGGVYSATKVVISAAPAPSGPTPLPGDTVSYYLVQHVLQAGETVSGICASLGVDFGEYSDTIIKINNISSYYYLLPGRTLLIPSKTQPTSGSYYKVLGHKLVSGDTIYGLCLTYGLNFYTYSDLIKQLNNVKDLGWFYVGQTVYMPLYVSNGSGAVVSPSPAVVSPSAPVTGAPVTAAPTAPASPGTSTAPSGSPKITVVTPTPAPINVPAEDTLSYLIIPHALQPGETVSGICADLGVDYLTCSDRIMQLSNVNNLNYLTAGKVLYIPSTVYPPAGTPYYKIMSHTLVAGDTVYDLCTAYGLDYLNNVSFIQRINSRDNLSNYYVGQTICMPLYVAG